MVFRCNTFRRVLLCRHTWLIAPAVGLSWQSQRQQKPVQSLTPPIVVFSPSELRLSRFWEYILTAKRFIYLFVLFVPALVLSPMLLVGRPQKSLCGDRWGAVWWYGLLVSRMEAAGPTFIKVRKYILLAPHSSFNFVISWLNGPLQGPTSFLLCYANVSVLSTLAENHTLSPTQKPSSKPFSNNHLIAYSNPLNPTPLGREPLPRYPTLSYLLFPSNHHHF